MYLAYYASPSNAYSFAPNFANSVRKNGTEKCLSIGSLLEETKESLPFDLFSQFLSQMTPENCFIERCSKKAWEEATGGNEEIPDTNPDDIFGLKVEQWYGVKYHLSPIEKSVVKLWNENFNPGSTYLRLPDKNEFIARDLSLCDDLAKNGPRISHEMKPPNLINIDGFGRLWHRLDDRYCLPKSSVSILLRTPSTNNILDQKSNKWIYDTDTAMHTSILLNVFSDALAQETYDAEIAGLHWNLSNTPSGLILRCSGYSEHLPKFTLHILSLFFADQKTIDGVFLEEKYLSAIKDRFLRSFSSYFESKRADTYASYYTGFLLSSESKGMHDTIRATESIDLSSLRRHHHNLISNCKFEVDCLVGGNISKADAEKLFDGVKNIVEGTSRMDDVTPNVITGPIERKLKEGEEVHLHFQSQNTEEQNGCVLMSFQSSTPAFKGRHLSTNESLVRSAAVRTICHMIREPMFNQLRTKEQLGYIVSAYYDNSLSCTSNKDQSSLDETSTALSSTTPIDSLVINVLSKKVPPPVLTQRIDEFLNTFGDKLKYLPEEEMKSHTDALSKKMKKPKQKLGDEMHVQQTKIRNYAPEIIGSNGASGKMPWDSGKELADAIEGLNRADLVKTWNDMVVGKRRTRIVSHVYGNTFPFKDTYLSDFEARNKRRNVQVLTSLDSIKDKRNTLAQYSDRIQTCGRSNLLNRRNVAVLGAIGTGLAFFLLSKRNTSVGDKKK